MAAVITTSTGITTGTNQLTPAGYVEVGGTDMDVGAVEPDKDPVPDREAPADSLPVISVCAGEAGEPATLSDLDDDAHPARIRAIATDQRHVTRAWTCQ